jgi:hypothetical protein
MCTWGCRAKAFHGVHEPTDDRHAAPPHGRPARPSAVSRGPRLRQAPCGLPTRRAVACSQRTAPLTLVAARDGARDRLERPTGLTAHRGRITRRAGARLVGSQAAEDARGGECEAGRVAQDTQRASAWRPRDERGWSAWSAWLQHEPASVSRATPGEGRGTRLHAPWPGVGHSHYERGARVPGAHPQRGGGVPAGQRVGRMGLAYTGHAGGGTGMQLAYSRNTTLHMITAPRGHAHEEHRVRNRTKSLHSLFSIAWLG